MAMFNPTATFLKTQVVNMSRTFSKNNADLQKRTSYKVSEGSLGPEGKYHFGELPYHVRCSHSRDPSLQSPSHHLLSSLILMENQRAHLNTLPAPLVCCTLIDEGRMRHPPRPPVNLAVKAFDQKHLLWRLSAQIIPSMFSIRSYRVCLPSSIGVD
jgi:hypothetical protein